MITRGLAEALRAAGLSWQPANGDRFLVPDRDLDEQVFVISDMVIENLRLPRGQHVLAFNGTTEWALDSLDASEAVWLPREDQLRDALGEAFMSLELLAGETSGFAVTLLVGDREQRFVDVDVEDAYARAVLALLESAR
ncbi:MAG: pilus assembly protein CpaE [Nocardioides sp.]